MSDVYYEKGILVELHDKSKIDDKKLSYTRDDRKIYITNKIIIKTLSSYDKEYFVKTYDLKFVKNYAKVYIFEVSNIESVLPLCKTIYENESVVYVQPSFLRTIKHHSINLRNENINKFMKPKIISYANENTKSMLDSNNSVNYYKYYDDIFRYQDDSFWHIYNNGSWNTTAGMDDDTYNIESVYDVDTNVLDVIDQNITGKGVKVLVVDSSFALAHPDLKFSNTYNFNLQNKDITPDSTADYHGTAVAGVIGANRGNNYGTMGIAPDSYIIAFNGLFDIENDDLFLESYIDIFYEALALDVDIINCSWTSSYILDEASIDAIDTFINEARDKKGGFVVFSSGNENTTSLLNEPALKNVISVGSIEADGSRSTYSNYGVKLDLVAPSNFVTLDIVGENGFSPSEMGFVAGTSFSAPIVSGIIALLLEVDPNITLDNALDIIYSTTKQIGDYSYSYDIDGDNRYNILYEKSLETGYGLIDAKAIVEKARDSINQNTAEILEDSFLENISNGWNFLGTSKTITDFSIFDSVSIVWIYKDNTWLGYSPNIAYAKELRKQDKLLTQIDKNSGVWIYKDEN